MHRETALAVLVSAGLVACGSDDEVLDCETVAYETCDIRASTCQSLVFDQIRCLRGDVDVEGRPRVSVVAEEELREAFSTALVESEPDPDVGRAFEAFALLGLVDTRDTSTDSQVELTLAGLLGFYSYQSREIVVVDRGEPLDDELATTTLGHEYVHALQDREFGLQEFRADVSTSYDATLSATSVIEGEAMLYDGFQLARLRDVAPESIDWPELYAESAAVADELTHEERSPLLTASSYFPYSYGPHTSSVVWSKHGQGGIVRVRTRDLSTHGYLARRLGGAAFVPEFDALLELELESMPDRRSLGAESLGAWMLHAVAMRRLGEPVTPNLALAWRGDVLSIFVDDEGEAAELVWQLRLATAADATALVDLVNQRPLTEGGVWQARTSEALAIIVASTDSTASLEPLFAGAGEPAQATDPSSARYIATPEETALERGLARLNRSCIH